MTILTDLIFMAVDAWFSDYYLDRENTVLCFPSENDVEDFAKQINFRLHDLRQFDNFKGGYCIPDDTRTTLVVILFLLEDEEIITCTKNFEITY